MTSLSGFAPAKLNLFLHVLGRRPDGYHELQTLFQLIDLCDEVRVESRGDGRVVRAPLPDDSPLAGLPAEQDLVVRAALLLQPRAPQGSGVTIHLRKRIPAGGGLGGGSSDAATTLRLLNGLWSLGLPVDELAALGLALGADVPVFVRGHSAWGEGRGERLTPVALPGRWFVVIHPGVHVSTAAVFGDERLRRDSPRLAREQVLRDPWAGTRNDCEPVARARHPEIATALDWLAARSPHARLTGTGACLFAPFEAEAQARAVAAQVPPAWTAFVARSIDGRDPA